MAFPVEEGLKHNAQEMMESGTAGFYGLSSRRRIETSSGANTYATFVWFLWPFQ